MRLLTKEQQETVENAKDKLSAVLKAGEALNIGAAVEWLSECNVLLAIIDDLQARAPRQYTEQELREAYVSTHRIDPIAVGISTWHSERYAGWEECARFLGALKAEQ